MATDSIDRVGLGPTLSNQAYLSLREGIMTGKLLPGERLTERSLASLLGISATPVREALRLLEHERLIERDEVRTIRVADPSLRHLYELTLAEAALRSVAARLAAERATASEVQTLLSLCDEAEKLAADAHVHGQAADVLRITRRFHQLIDASSHSESLVTMIATATAFDFAFRAKWSTTVHRTSESLRVSLGEHRAIAEAIAANDASTAERLTRDHVLQRATAFLDVAAREGDPAPSD